LLYESNRFHIIKIGGRKAVPFTDTFWHKWKDYAGMCSGDQIDFCLIYDEKPETEANLLFIQCENRDCIWSRTKIEEAVKLLDIKEPTEIINENRTLLTKTGCFINARKEDIISMTALYNKSEKLPDPTDVSPDKMTSLIKHYQGELQTYKMGYET